jgi:hypothetical protein
MTKLTEVRTAEQLAAFIGPRLDDLAADANLQGSVYQSVDPLLDALPRQVVLNRQTIIELGLDAPATAYLIFELWRRAQPELIRHGASMSNKLSEVLAACLEWSGHTTVDWFTSGAPVADVVATRKIVHDPLSGPSQGFIPWKDTMVLEPTSLAEPTAVFKHVPWRLHLQTVCHLSPKVSDRVLIELVPPGGALPEWTIKSETPLRHLPTSMLRQLRKCLAAFLPSAAGVNDLVKRLRARARADDSTMAATEAVLGVIDRELSLRDVEVAKQVLAAFKRGDLDALVGKTSLAAIQAMARGVV